VPRLVDEKPTAAARTLAQEEQFLEFDSEGVTQVAGALERGPLVAVLDPSQGVHAHPSPDC
jgi:hypothetical protein